MKKMLMWLLMLLKRQLKKPSLYVIMLCMFGCTFFIHHVAVKYTVNIEIGVLNQDIHEGETEDRNIAAHIVQLMTEHKGLVKFVEYQDRNTLTDDVRSSKVYAGYIFGKGFADRVRDNDMNGSVKVLSTPGNIVAKFANELVFSQIMKEYTYNLLLYDIYESDYFDEDREEMAEKLREFYIENSTNGSTFSAEYSGTQGMDRQVELDIYDYISPIAKGIIGVLIFLAGLCGTMILYEDQEAGAFSRFTGGQTTVISLTEILIPTLITTAVGYGCLVYTGLAAFSSGGVLHMAGYLVLVVLYCFVLKSFISNKIVFAALVPVLLIASLLFCHVFVNLSTIVPEFNYLAMLLPPNYF